MIPRHIKDIWDDLSILVAVIELGLVYILCWILKPVAILKEKICMEKRRK